MSDRDEAFMKVGSLRLAHSALVAAQAESPEGREALNEAIRFCHKAVLREWEHASANSGEVVKNA